MKITKTVLSEWQKHIDRPLRKKITVCDIHLGTYQAKDKEWKELDNKVKERELSQFDIIINGDHIDFGGCRKKELTVM